MLVKMKTKVWTRSALKQISFTAAGNVDKNNVAATDAI